MFDKYKRYRERQREGRVAVKVEYRLLLRQLRNLPLNITEVYATLSREGKIVKLPTRPAEGGQSPQLCLPTSNLSNKPIATVLDAR